jgi:hypothetical protein
MALWLWLNLGLGALFVLAIVGVPLWLVLTRPDTPPARAELPAWRRVREQHARQAAARQAAAADQRLAHQSAAQRWNPAADN